MNQFDFLDAAFFGPHHERSKAMVELLRVGMSREAAIDIVLNFTCWLYFEECLVEEGQRDLARKLIEIRDRFLDDFNHNAFLVILRHKNEQFFNQMSEGPALESE